MPSNIPFDSKGKYEFCIRVVNNNVSRLLRVYITDLGKNPITKEDNYTFTITISENTECIDIFIVENWPKAVRYDKRSESFYILEYNCEIDLYILHRVKIFESTASYQPEVLKRYCYDINAINNKIKNNNNNK
jgi:hypothetical protein